MYFNQRFITRLARIGDVGAPWATPSNSGFTLVGRFSVSFILSCCGLGFLAYFVVLFVISGHATFTFSDTSCSVLANVFANENMKVHRMSVG